MQGGHQPPTCSQTQSCSRLEIWHQLLQGVSSCCRRPLIEILLLSSLQLLCVILPSDVASFLIVVFAPTTLFFSPWCFLSPTIFYASIRKTQGGAFSCMWVYCMFCCCTVLNGGFTLVFGQVHQEKWSEISEGQVSLHHLFRQIPNVHPLNLQTETLRTSSRTNCDVFTVIIWSLQGCETARLQYISCWQTARKATIIRCILITYIAYASTYSISSWWYWILFIAYNIQVTF